MIDSFPNKEEIKRSIKTPATDYLFEIREVKKLATDKARIFHNIVAKDYFMQAIESRYTDNNCIFDNADLDSSA